MGGVAEGRDVWCRWHARPLSFAVEEAMQVEGAQR